MVPPGSVAATTSTRFRFDQRSFSAARDQWALDNVRVLRYVYQLYIRIYILGGAHTHMHTYRYAGIDMHT